ncbi:NAD(+) diphosphatase [Demequina sp. NBRC 110055]|uniref:NAD(+) diphosphatase n=1 Tax=Demequina sp. NBRC 110055 TaxID=1570344 RepID=UPI001F2EA186|nr:NAD(+) diphosphatase [Demequina sp. NBRC 110055]
MTVSPYLEHPLLIDRQAHRRVDVDLATTDAVVASRGAVLMRDGRLMRVPGDAIRDATLRAFLGHEGGRGSGGERDRGGRDVGLVVPTDPDVDLASWIADGATLTPLRAVLGALTDDPDGQEDRELATTAVALAAWHDTHGRCARCGEPTVAVQGGWVRRCEAEQRDHYPRTDPAIIVAVTDADERLLLAHAAHWSAGRFSHLAGYVEPGESFEQAVHREVAEEVGIDVADVAYVASQPWPFPASVMVGFRARAASSDLTPDGVEITEARWVSRGQFAAEVAAGTLVPPPVGSIARALLEDWLGAPAVETAPDDVSDT